MAIPAPALPSFIPNPDTTVASSNGGIIRREDIPAGVEIRSIEEPGDPGDSSPNPTEILKRSDCSGSHYCYAISYWNCLDAYSVCILVTCTPHHHLR